MRELRIAYLAAGAAGMYCGSCIRDNRVAATLKAAGRDVTLIPLYTPLRTDDADVSTSRVLYGGLNVYLEQRFPWLRLLPRWITRPLDSRFVLQSLSRWSGAVSPRSLGALTVSVLQGRHGRQRAELEKMIDWLGPMRPTIVHLPNLPFIGVAGELRKALGVKVFCTMSGEDIFLDDLPQPYRTQAFDLIRTHAREVDAFVATSDYYADHSAHHFGLPRERIHTVRLGVTIDESANEEPSPDGPFTIGYLARICPEKGLADLCEAFVLLRRAKRDCRLRIAGYLAESQRPFVRGMIDYLRQPATYGAVDFLGEVDREGKQNFLRSLNVLSVPTVYHEAKGLYILEAMACGVPVVQPRHGSFPELIDATGGGVLYDPGSGVPGLAAAIAELMDDQTRCRELGARGRKAVRESFTDAIMAEQTWSLYQRFAG